MVANARLKARDASWHKDCVLVLVELESTVAMQAEFVAAEG